MTTVVSTLTLNKAFKAWRTAFSKYFSRLEANIFAPKNLSTQLRHIPLKHELSNENRSTPCFAFCWSDFSKNFHKRRAYGVIIHLGSFLNPITGRNQG